MTKPTPQKGHRPPIVAIVGHIDHGKSTLLDYIRNTKVVEGEAGGITQHLSAYEATHTNSTGEHRITFLDTPGHEAFVGMRSRGLEVADVAILIVSAEEGAKVQTKEAVKLILGAGIPYVVAFTKIDKPGANLEKAKLSMLEAEVFLEGLGGEVPWVAISSKTGEGIPELLDLILLAAELEEVSADTAAAGQGVVIEAHVDQKRGNTATLIITDGMVESGKYIVAGEAMAPVRIMENFLSKPIKEAHAGSPIRIVGFTPLPQVGDTWQVVNNKKEAEAAAAESRRIKGDALKSPDVKVSPLNPGTSETPLASRITLPIIIKTDVAGTGEAVLHEIEKLPQSETLEVKVVTRTVGAITEGDVKSLAGSSVPGIIVGFNVKVEGPAQELAERQGVTVATFDIIYKLAEWLGEEVEKRRPRLEAEEVTGAAKILKYFSGQKGRVVIGGRVEEGVLNENAEVKIMRRDLELGRGKIVSLQAQKIDVKKVEAGTEFGMQLKTDVEPAAGDRLEAYTVVLK